MRPSLVMHTLSRVALLAACVVFALLLGGAPASATDLLDRITFTLTPQYTTVTGAGSVASPTQSCPLPLGANGTTCVRQTNPNVAASTYQPRLNYSATIAISKRFNFAYSHLNLDQALNSLNLGTLGVYTTGNLWDRFDTFTINNFPNPHLILSAQYYHRTRIEGGPVNSKTNAGTPSGCNVLTTICGGDANSVSGGVNQNDYRLSSVYSFGRRSKIGYPFSVFATLAYSIHPAGVANCYTFSATVPGQCLPYVPASGVVPNFGTPYNGNMLHLATYGGTVKIPVNDRTIIPYVTLFKGDTAFVKDPGLLLFNYMKYGVTKILTKNITFDTNILNLRQTPNASYTTSYLPNGNLNFHETVREVLWTTTLSYSFKLK